LNSKREENSSGSEDLTADTNDNPPMTTRSIRKSQLSNDSANRTDCPAASGDLSSRIVGGNVSGPRDVTVAQPSTSAVSQTIDRNVTECANVAQRDLITTTYDPLHDQSESRSFSELQLDDITLDHVNTTTNATDPVESEPPNVTTKTNDANMPTSMIARSKSIEDFEMNCSTPDIDEETYERMTGTQIRAAPSVPAANTSDIKSQIAELVSGQVMLQLDDDFDENTPPHMNPTPLSNTSQLTCSTQLSDKAPTPVPFTIYQDQSTLHETCSSDLQLSTSAAPTRTSRSLMDYLFAHPIISCDGDDEQDDPLLYDIELFKQFVLENRQHLP
jgi:hypothetical protein